MMDSREGILDGKCKGICILVANDDFTCRNIATEMLKHCPHEELFTGRISEAKSIMWERKDNFELVLTNAHRLESDEFDIVQCIQNRFDLPTILMSPDKVKIVSNGEDYIVSAYIANSLRRKDINCLWQSALQKVKAKKEVAKLEGNSQERSLSYNGVEAENNSSPGKEPVRVRHQRKGEEDRNSSEQNEVRKVNKKKPRMVWTRDMHQKFLEAVEFLGRKNEVPTKIADRMKVPGITREKVASHLQKHRESRKRDPIHDTNTRNPYSGSRSFPSLRFDSLQRKNSSIFRQGFSPPFHQGSYFLNCTSTLNNQRITRFLNRTAPKRNNYATPRGLDNEAYGEKMNRDNSSTGTNLSINSDSTYAYVGLRFANDGNSIECGQHKVSTHNNVMSSETQVSDLRSTGDELMFNLLGTNMESFSSPSTVADCISLLPSQPETSENSSFHQSSSIPLPQMLQESNDFLTEGEMSNIFLREIGTSYPQYTLEDFDDSFFVDDESGQ